MSFRGCYANRGKFFDGINGINAIFQIGIPYL
jgi:hypothetical protein